jgi:hypothetical protein
VFVRCGLKVGLSDEDTMRGLIPTHVKKKAEGRNKASQGRLVFPPKGFWISKTNILAPTLFYVCVFFCFVTKNGMVLFLESIDSLTLRKVHGCYKVSHPGMHLTS